MKIAGGEEKRWADGKGERGRGRGKCIGEGVWQ